MGSLIDKCVFALSIYAAMTVPLRAQTVQTPGDAITSALTNHEYDVAGDGRQFLLAEAKDKDFFLLGELHGDNEIPSLIRALWLEMWRNGYRHVAAEVSPWTAHKLEKGTNGKVLDIEGLWTRRQATDVHAYAGPRATVLWGCDMEELHPELLIRQLASLNSGNSSLDRMRALTQHDYQRSMAKDLLALLREGKPERDVNVNDISLRQNLLATLEIDRDRSSPGTKMAAQNERELLMKTQLLEHLRNESSAGSPSKTLLRFGRNHLHRGYDARGISTLGNFVVEFAISRGQGAFNVGAFGAGGKATLMGETFSADERKDEPAFALLAENAHYAATVYDLRPVRTLLHAIPHEKRTELENNLIYWADAYDALICYKSVTPLQE